MQRNKALSLSDKSSFDFFWWYLLRVLKNDHNKKEAMRLPFYVIFAAINDQQSAKAFSQF